MDLYSVKKSIIVFICLTLSNSCNYTSKNNIKDKKEAEFVTDKFYILLRSHNTKEASKLFGKKFFKVTSQNDLNNMFTQSYQTCGEIKKDSLIKWGTTVIKGTNSYSGYDFTYKVKRNLKNTREIISLQKEGDSIKIVGYSINLDF